MAIKGKDNRLVTNHDYNDGRVPRTLTDRQFNWRSTFNSGYLLPLWCDECYPSEVKTIDFGMLVRSITPLGPTMDNSFLDVYFFFVPNRLIWTHWEEMIAGYNKEAWAQGVVYETPKIIFKGDLEDFPETEPAKRDKYIHSFLDYCAGACDVVALHDAQYGYNYDGGPASEDSINDVFWISALYPRSYALIWNTYFRDQNLQNELEIYKGDNDEYADDFLSFNLLDAEKLPKAAKLKNRFTTAWPQPQKGPDVLIPMNNLPVVTGAEILTGAHDPLKFKNIDGSIPSSGSHNLNIYSDGSNAVAFGQNSTNSQVGDQVYPSNLIASNVSNTIRQLRVAVQTEKFLYKDAKGTRYNESLITHFGQHSSMARLDMPEYLGSRQIPLQIMQVTNTAGTDNDPLGNVGGQSMTKDNARYCKFACPEHGIIWCVGVVRTNISYHSGVRKMYQRGSRFEYIWPEFRHIGDVPLYKRELWINETILGDNGVFGYTPYGSELREGYNFNNGLFRPDVTGSFSYLTYQETYSSDSAGPTLSDKYIEQPTYIISRTLTVQEGPQFYGLFNLVCHDVIPLDSDSDPMMMDHF